VCLEKTLKQVVEIKIADWTAGYVADIESFTDCLTTVTQTPTFLP
jgi:hypothetical protein